MSRYLNTVVVVAGLAFSVYFVVGGATVQDQLNFLVDAGYTAATHRAECPVVLSDDCLDAGRQAGLTLHKYERLAFPVAVRVQSDGGRDVQMPPMNLSLAGRCIEVVDWTDCTLNAAQVATVASLLGQQLPFTPVGAVKAWVRPKRDAGLGCYRRAADGGVWDFGDRNVFPRAEALNDLDCELVGAGVVYAGADPEKDL